MKLSQADIYFSLCVRAASGWICQRCGIHKPPTGKRGGSGLECSHRFGRRHRTIRWCKENADCLCSGCHRFFGENPADYRDWMVSQDGEKVIAILREKRDSMVKISKKEEKAIVAHYRSELNKIESAQLQGKRYEFISYQ